jgi:uncharacterized damage-inducible protein DinB
MKAYLQKLLDYNTWANRRFLACLLESTVVNNKVFLLFSHVLTAEEVWLSRAQGNIGPVQRLWEIYSNDALQKMVEENSQAWHLFLENCEKEDLVREVSYQNTKGETFSTRLDDIITHMTNHGTHHRAQIASMLQQEKVQPPASDYIVFIRDQKSALVV